MGPLNGPIFLDTVCKPYSTYEYSIVPGVDDWFQFVHLLIAINEDIFVSYIVTERHSWY